jgi:asparagine synthase (glutamine-hydrolysing)
LVKRAFSPLLPKPIIERRKAGFGVPLALWFREELREFARDTILNGTLVKEGYISADFVEELLTAHSTSERDFSTLIWNLIVLEKWYQTWIEKTP